MKKALIILLDAVVCALLTFVLFETMSWNHFGDIPTKTVLIRLIAFYCVLLGISISIIALLTKNKSNDNLVLRIKKRANTKEE